MDDLGERIARARAYLRSHEQQRRERVRRVALACMPLAGLLLMFWRA